MVVYWPILLFLILNFLCIFFYYLLYTYVITAYSSVVKIVKINQEMQQCHFELIDHKFLLDLENVSFLIGVVLISQPCIQICINKYPNMGIYVCIDFSWTLYNLHTYLLFLSVGPSNNMFKGAAKFTSPCF